MLRVAVVFLGIPLGLFLVVVAGVNIAKGNHPQDQEDPWVFLAVGVVFVLVGGGLLISDIRSWRRKKATEKSAGGV